MIALLEPLFQGNWATLAEGLSSEAAPPGALRLADLLDQPPLFGAVLQRHADHLACGDLRAVGASWALNYFLKILPPFVAAASLLQHRFPMAPQHLMLTLDQAGLPARLHLPHEGEFIPGSALAARYDELVWQHLAPLILALGRQARLSGRLLWGNATRYLEATLDQLIRKHGETSGLGGERERLLRHAAWPDGRPNPWFAAPRTVLREIGGNSVSLALHRSCCLSHLLPGQVYCHACPLAPANRTRRIA